MLKTIRISAILLIAAGFAHAVPVRWTITGATLDDGGTASGSFVYDAATNSYSAIDISTTNGSTFSGAHFTAVVPTQAGILTSVFLLATPTPGAADFTGIRVLPLFFNPALTGAGGTASLTSGPTKSYETTCANAACSGPGGTIRNFVAGSIVGSPLSAVGAPTLSEWGMILLAFGLLAVAARSLFAKPTVVS